METVLPREPARAAVNAAILTSFAIVQPLFDVLARAPEFLVAHQATPSAIVALAIALAFLVPALPALIVWIAARLHRGAGRWTMALVVTLAVGLLALLTLRRWEAADGRVLIGIAAVIGAVAALLYTRLPAVRAFTTWLAPGLVLFPLLFLFGSGIRSLVLPHGAEAQASSNSQTPVVFVILDQLPLSSLLAPDHTIDRAAYPAFAALADDATWYRNATAVSDFTKWSVPSILTGRVPVATSLPVAAHHPASLFTLLGESHRPHVFEPITGMCPVEICGRAQESSAEWVRGISRTLGTAYLHAIVPADLAGGLPQVDQGWNEQAGASTLGASIGVRWYEAHRKGRRREVLDFIGEIGESSDARPPLHYLHVLLPHEPFIYFPDGHRYTIETRLPGLISRERWRDDDWAAVQAYQRYLLQLAYVDTLLGQLLDRLKATGLYDRSLIVVTSDHGASFHAARMFRKVTPETFADILPVPLFIKEPNQQAGRIDERNVESIDIVPTVADLLDIPMEWAADGASALDPATERAAKRVFHDDARREMAFPRSLLDDLYRAVERRHALFGAPAANPSFVPRTSPFGDLIGADVAAQRVTDDGRGQVDVTVFGDFADVSLQAETLPAYLAGTARSGGNGEAALAIALNGRIRMTTRTYNFVDAGAEGAWSAVVPPDAFIAGRNNLEIFVIERDAGGVLLRRAFTSGDLDLDLSSPAAVYAWGVTQEGLHTPERRGDNSFRWTEGVARLTVPIRPGRAPRALNVQLLMSGRNDKPLRVTINGCELYSGAVPAGRWARVFDLSACPELGESAVIELRTEEDRPRNPRDRRRLGVAIDRIDLLDALPQG